MTALVLAGAALAVVVAAKIASRAGYRSGYRAGYAEGLRDGNPFARMAQQMLCAVTKLRPIPANVTAEAERITREAADSGREQS